MYINERVAQGGAREVGVLGHAVQDPQTKVSGVERPVRAECRLITLNFAKNEVGSCISYLLYEIYDSLQNRTRSYHPRHAANKQAWNIYISRHRGRFFRYHQPHLFPLSYPSLYNSTVVCSRRLTWPNKRDIYTYHYKTYSPCIHNIFA